jgi:signal peptidase
MMTDHALPTLARQGGDAGATDTTYVHRDVAHLGPSGDQARPGRGRVNEAPEHTDLPLWRRLLSWLFTLALIALVVYLWPAGLGGNTRLVIVSGHSMEPTYDFGDIVIARDGGRPHVGDAVVFEVPDGTAKGMLVIHRIIEVDDDGYFVTQGDNRDTPDQWQLTDDNIVGHPWLSVPKGGQAVWFLRQWNVLAVLLGLLVVFALWPHHHHVDADDDNDAPGDPYFAATSDRAGAAAGRFVAGTGAEPVDDDWTQSSIDPAVMDDAASWLDEQLGAARRESADAPPLERRVRPGSSGGVVVTETEVQRIRAKVLQTAR